jgi:predicted nucleic acid-binding protein
VASLVLDGSITIAWFMPDERTAGTQRVLDQVTQEGAAVPALWCLEVGNTLLLAARRRRISPDDCATAITTLEELPIETDSETASQAWDATFQLAGQFRLTLYDACYLELAQRRNLPLATLDRDLRAAGDALGIEVLGA